MQLDIFVPLNNAHFLNSPFHEKENMTQLLSWFILSHNFLLKRRNKALFWEISWHINSKISIQI